MEKEHAPKAQITIPAARTEQEARPNTPQRLEQPQLESADGRAFSWPGRTVQPTPETPVFLRGQLERGMAVTVARELLQEQAEQAKQHQRHLQQSRESYYRTKHPDPEVQREIWRVKQANYRARKRQEAQAQVEGEQPDNRT